MPAAAATPTTDAGRDPLKTDLVYAALRARIRDLVLPPGAALRKDELAAEFGVSRAPINEAIARLADEGLAEVFPQHGSFVAVIRASDVREGLFIRVGLETEAMREAARAASPALIAALDANLAAQARALASKDLNGFFDLDEALHGLIFAAAGAGRARRLLDAARAPLDRVRRMALPEPGRAEETLSEHRRLVEAIRMGDSDYAAAAMRAHLAAVSRSVERQLARIDHVNDR
jgi:DNA-binding GntR family transcriptional regulator